MWRAHWNIDCRYLKGLHSFQWVKLWKRSNWDYQSEKCTSFSLRHWEAWGICDCPASIWAWSRNDRCCRMDQSHQAASNKRRAECFCVSGKANTWVYSNWSNIEYIAIRVQVFLVCFSDPLILLLQIKVVLLYGNFEFLWKIIVDWVGGDEKVSFCDVLEGVEGALDVPPFEGAEIDHCFPLVIGSDVQMLGGETDRSCEVFVISTIWTEPLDIAVLRPRLVVP